MNNGALTQKHRAANGAFSKSRPLKTIDLFAGCGGFTLGLHMAGHRLLFAIEKDPMAFDTFRTNFIAQNAPYRAGGNWPAWLPIQPHDINNLLKDQGIRANLARLRGTIDLVCGGPPCQGFSVGGIRDGKDARNELPQRYLEFVGLVRPNFVLLENVEGMARKFISKPGEVEPAFADWLIAKLAELGYDATFVIVDTSTFGVPQIRRRVILFGVRHEIATRSGVSSKMFFSLLDSLRAEFLAYLGLPLNRPITTKEAIDDLCGKRRTQCPDSPKFQTGSYKIPQSRYATLLRRGIPNDQVPNSHRYSNHLERTLSFYGKVHDLKLFGRLPKSFLMEHGTKKDKKVLIDPSAPASTITTHPDEFIHYLELRNITVREMARIQSFPDDFIFKGRYTINGPRRRLDVARCSQVGNAVPPLFAEAIGWTLHAFEALTRSKSDPTAVIA